MHGSLCRRNGRLGEMPRATAATFPEAPKELPPEQPPLSERGFDAADHPLSGVPNVEAPFNRK